MKPIIIEMKDISDSVEVYESKPGRALVSTIYIILGLFVAAFLWMAFSEIEIVVKANGMLRCDERTDGAGKENYGQTAEFYAEVYVKNADIAKLKVGQQVTFEIAAYPSDEYGCFTGQIEELPTDITMDSKNGTAYYLLHIPCDGSLVRGKDGDEVTLINGMACQAKVIVDEENILKYFLRKIDLLD